ncbi:MAG: hypothetical protein A3J93_00640 [Candidatus Magasanikbacteria bacterium RIFOXYC2_FULL_42_28]|uniref:PEP-utilising enzyme mobile domain-containing protein n=1 Tax=Candidatus Magasanikbacteria bacterium RIFOXYC2_FULL_42_28 TaxID=1798704 RepID=A0A1F6NXF1_9BACT|nr:MAG: hypothetical protein A3J93_00640 [Candidatus Magasanikbacteria bacterium RIFOXYC2_FULL_42_28]
MDLTKLYQTQISLTEWLEKIGHPQTDAIRVEDNSKRPRMKILNEIIGLPYDKPYNFSAREIADNALEFQKLLIEHGEELCALRLVPTVEGLPKLRNRGFKIKDSIPWFWEQKIDPDKYKVEVVPHSDKPLFSTIFIVNERGIYGEVVVGTHALLTQGFYGESRPITFAYDWSKWKFSEDNQKIVDHVLAIAKHLLVDDDNKRKEISSKLDVKFYHNYLAGYFETIINEDTGLWFIDYNRILGNIYKDYSCLLSGAQNIDGVSGQSGSGGKTQGRVRIVKTKEDLATAKFNDGEVLVCGMTAPEYLPLMIKAVAVITDMGGILSHAAIVCRELKKPAVVGTKNATQVLKDGDLVEVDGENGAVRMI